MRKLALLCMVTLVILLISSVIPYKEWSARFTALLHLSQGSIAYRMVDNILPSLILNTFNNSDCFCCQCFFKEAIPVSEQVEVRLHGIIYDWPITFAVSYFAAFSAEAIGKRIAEAAVKSE